MQKKKEMTKDDDFKLLKIQTFTLKVSIHCDGCRYKVKKLLQKIEGVYSMSIDAENQKVTVTGSVDSSTVIRKLAGSGKHAEFLSSQKSNQNQKPNPNQKQQQQRQQQQQQQQKGPHPTNNANKNNSSNNNKTMQQQGKQGLMQGLKAFKSQHKNIPSLSSDEDDLYDDDDEDEDDEEMRMITEKMNLLRQANNAVANAKKNGNDGGGNGGNAGGKKGGVNPNQIKLPIGPDQKAKMANAANMGGNGMMGPGGMNHVLPSNGQHHQQQQPMMGMGMGMHPSMTMNMRAGQGVGGHINNNNMMMMHDNRLMQPQMMYQRAPQVSPYTGYHHHYQYYPSPYLNNQAAERSDYGVDLFSDENANSCSVM